MVVIKVISGKWCQCEMVPSENFGGRQMWELSKSHTVDGFIYVGNSSKGEEPLVELKTKKTQRLWSHLEIRCKWWWKLLPIKAFQWGNV